jgi:alkylmercury lyase
MEHAPGCLDDGREAMLRAALPVRRIAFKMLLSGTPAPIETVASAAGIAERTARQAASDVAAVGMAQLEDGDIVGMDGLTMRPTQHSLIIDDVQLWTWCAYDVVGIAAALGVSARGETQCGSCGRNLVVEIRDGVPATDGRNVGWLPSQACSNVMAEFCPSALLFCSKEHVEEWRVEAGATRGEALDLLSLAQRGREEWGQLVSTPSR